MMHCWWVPKGTLVMFGTCGYILQLCAAMRLCTSSPPLAKLSADLVLRVRAQHMHMHVDVHARAPCLPACICSCVHAPMR